MGLTLAPSLLKPPHEGNSPRGGAWNGQATKETSRAPPKRDGRFAADSIGGIPRPHDRIAAAGTRCRAAPFFGQRGSAAGKEQGIESALRDDEARIEKAMTVLPVSVRRRSARRS